MSGRIAEGAALPSVRQIAMQERLNPLTVSKAFALLIDSGLVEARRGLGMFVINGARDRARASAQQRFLDQEWPPVLRRIGQLGLDAERLFEDR